MAYLNHIFLITLIITINCLNNPYQQFKTITSIGDRNKIAVSQDDAWMLLYGGTQSQTMIMYSTFTFQKIFQIPDTRTYVKFFINQNNNRSFVSGNKQGDVYYNNFENNQNQSGGLLKLNKLESSIIKVIPNYQNTMYAAICQGSTSIHFSTLTKISEVQTIDLNTTINGISWHPNEDQIAIALKPNQNNTKLLVIYDYNKKQFNDITQHISNITEIIDLQYSQDGSQIAYIGYNSTQQQTSEYIVIKNLTDFTQEYLIAPQSSKLMNLQRQGSVLTAYDQTHVYIWQFNGVNYGKYQSILKSVGLSRSASYLVTLDSLQQQLKVYKFCNGDHQYFNNKQNLCKECDSSCLTCFTQQKLCSSCKNGQFLQYQDYTCGKCIDNCKICKDSKKCQTCNQGFYNDQNNICQVCSLGCLGCNQKQSCVTCDTNKHWILNSSSLCQCQAKFYLNQTQCDKCIDGCLKCQNSQQCRICDDKDHRILSNKTCICDQRFFEKENLCQSCIKGCLTCQDNIECKKCDTNNKWIQNSTNCVCMYGFYDGGSIQCKSCASAISSCLNCLSKDKCLECLSGFTLDSQGKCIDDNDGSNTVTIILVVLASLVVIGVSIFFIVKIIKKRNAKKVETLLQDPQQLKSNQQSIYRKINN